MRASESVFKSIQRGREGVNKGIPTTLDALDNVIYGVQKECLVNIFADSGGGKTTFILYTYVYQPLLGVLSGKVKARFLYFSFEMSKEALLTKLLCLHVYHETGIVITFDEALSLKEVISDEHFAVLLSFSDWLSKAEEVMEILDKPIKPDKIEEKLRSWNSQFGKFIPTDDDKEEYLRDDEELYKIVIIDHIKLTADNGKGAKNTIDSVADHFIYYRNKCKITGVMIQQANRNSKGMDRKLNGYNMFQLDDASDSSAPAQASEVVIGLYYPYREKVNKIEGYNVKILKDRIRVCQVLKNRYGPPDVNIALNFFGEIGYFKMLPPSESIMDYEELLHIGDIDKTPKINKVVDSNDSMFTL